MSNLSRPLSLLPLGGSHWVVVHVQAVGRCCKSAVVVVVALISVVSVVLVVVRATTEARSLDMYMAKFVKAVVCNFCSLLNTYEFACSLAALYYT